MIPLIVALWQGAQYGGTKRLLVEDTPNLDLLGFNDQTHAVGLHPGPDYDAWQLANGQPPFAVLYDDNDYEGDGRMTDVGLSTFYDFGISSVRICPPITRHDVDIPIIYVDPAAHLDAAIAPVPLVVELFVDAPFRNHRVVVVENSASLASDFDAEFSGSASSVQVIAGPDYAGQAAVLWEREDFGGQNLILTPGSYTDLTELGFNDMARSVTVR